MNCFIFANAESGDDNEDGVVSRSSKVSWARSFSVASSSIVSRRSEVGSKSRDSLGFYEFLTQRRSNDLRLFTFAELKSATRGFSRALMIGEGGFGCVYGASIKVPDDDDNSLDSTMDVAVKQLNRSGFQA